MRPSLFFMWTPSVLLFILSHCLADESSNPKPSLGDNKKSPPDSGLNAITVRLTLLDADRLASLGRHADAEPKYRQVLAYWRKEAGEDNLTTGAAHFNVGFNLFNQNKNLEAQPFFEEALRICLKHRGEKDRETGQSYNALAINLGELGRFTEADRFQQLALDTFLKAGKEEHEDVLAVYNAKGNSLTARGRDAEGEPYLRKALLLALRLIGSNALDTGTYFNNLALNLSNQGKYSEAEYLFGQALAIYKKNGRDDHGDTADVLSNLALIPARLGDLKKAEEIHRRALTIRLKIGADTFNTSLSYNNLADVLDKANRFGEAEELYRKALTINRRIPGVRHPRTTLTRSNLAYVLARQGKLDEALGLYEEALDIRLKILGEDHPYTVDGYINLALALRDRGRYTEAEALLEKAAPLFEKVRLQTARQGLDRANYAVKHSPLVHLATLQARRGDFLAAWKNLEASLARGLFDDVSRPLKTSERDREQQLLWKLRKLDEKIIRASVSPRDKSRNDAAAKEVAQWHKQRLALTDELARFEQELLGKYGAKGGQVYEIGTITKALPENGALVCWLDMDTVAGSADPNGQHWACILRRDGRPRWIKIPGGGSDQSWSEADYEAANGLKRLLLKGPKDEAVWRDLGGRLAQQRLAPLIDALQATDTLPAVRHLIVLPSSALAGLPLEPVIAAWSQRPVDFTVSYAPSGTMFAYLRERQATAKVNIGMPEQLLALGDPKFKAAGQPGTQREAKAETTLRSDLFQNPLPHTREEVTAIAALFPRSEKLLGENANSSQLEELAASDGLKTYDYIHFATHGLANPREAMRSTLYLAEEPVSESVELLKGANSRDGQLTAEQILRTWKLDADLVTLSACESGLGPYAGGEGYLGFSQALFVAGSRSLVLSLWPVDANVATTLLMVRFYQNVLGKRAGLDEPMPKAFALEEAKRWLRRLDREKANELRQALQEGRSIDAFREDLENDSSGEELKDRPFDHPYYWAGFILIGDPGEVTRDMTEQKKTGQNIVSAIQSQTLPWFVVIGLLSVVVTAAWWRLRHKRMGASP